jgi:hypothetical protein
MAEPKIIRAGEVESAQLPGAKKIQAGWIKRILYSPKIQTKGVFFGVAEINPAIRFIDGTPTPRIKARGMKWFIPKFLRKFIILSVGWSNAMETGGRAKHQGRKSNCGKHHIMPVGIVEHQLFNNGNEKIAMVFCGHPTPKIILKE